MECNRARRRCRRHLPFGAVVIHLLLMSSMCFTGLTISLLPRLSQEEYDNLPLYCQPSTGFFECRNATSGITHCLPTSLKCRVRCSNNVELKCPGFGDLCPKPGQFACPGSPNATQCIADHLVCDGRAHCLDGSDESLELCKSRKCLPGQFACRSPGHCLPDSMRCDGSFDCERTGLADYSDELDCPGGLSALACRPGEFQCPQEPVSGRGGSCHPMAYKCDGFKDCPDGWDESDCSGGRGGDCDSAAGEVSCDGRCLKASLRCDGVADCASGADELGCGSSQCKFQSEFLCQLSQPAGTCVSHIFVCDGQRDCVHGEDEVCPIDDTALCSSDTYWTCKSGWHCVRNDTRCDGLPHCPDGSDEKNCPAVVRPASSAAPAAAIDKAATVPTAAAFGDICALEFGACDQLCSPTTGVQSFNCSCLPGYRMDSVSSSAANGTGRQPCRAVGAAKLLLATESGIHILDSETNTVTRLPADLKLPKFLDFDAAQKFVFFHTRDGLVGRLRMDDPAGVVTVLARDSVLDSLAYDWTRQLLYFTVPETAADTGSGFVGVMDAVTGRWAQLKLLSCPRGLALQPSSGQLYVSLWCGPRPGVYSMRLDGSDLRPLVTGWSGAPGHLTLDLAQAPGQRRLYWLDSLRRGVFSCRVADGSDLRAVWHMGQGYDGIPLGLSVFEDRLLWSDLRAGAVYSVDKFDGTPMRLVTTGPGNETVLSAVVYHSVRQPSTGGGVQCRCSGHVCISRAAWSSDAADLCLCDKEHVMTKAGVCAPAPGSATTASASLALSGSDGSAEVLALTGAGGGGSQGAVVAAAVTSALLLVCLVCGGLVACACLRRARGGDSRDGSCSRLSGVLRAVKFGSFGSSSGSGSGSGSASSHSSADSAERPTMPKINSRTPLTECEINMENQSNC